MVNLVDESVLPRLSARIVVISADGYRADVWIGMPRCRGNLSLQMTSVGGKPTFAPGATRMREKHRSGHPGIGKLYGHSAKGGAVNLKT